MRCVTGLPRGRKAPSLSQETKSAGGRRVLAINMCSPQLTSVSENTFTSRDTGKPRCPTSQRRGGPSGELELPATNVGARGARQGRWSGLLVRRGRLGGSILLPALDAVAANAGRGGEGSS